MHRSSTNQFWFSFLLLGNPPFSFPFPPLEHFLWICKCVCSNYFITRSCISPIYSCQDEHCFIVGKKICYVTKVPSLTLSLWNYNSQLFCKRQWGAWQKDNYRKTLGRKWSCCVPANPLLLPNQKVLQIISNFLTFFSSSVFNISFIRCKLQRTI